LEDSLKQCLPERTWQAPFCVDGPVHFEGEPHAALKAGRQVLLNLGQQPVADGHHVFQIPSQVSTGHFAGLQMKPDVTHMNGSEARFSF
jgi:hypothetical protein